MTLLHRPREIYRRIVSRMCEWFSGGAGRGTPTRQCRPRLRSELLEARELLAANLFMPRHNVFDAEDVNDDGVVSAIDAMEVINAIHRHDVSDDEVFTDVNNDGMRSPLDALRVINRLDHPEPLSSSTGRKPAPRDRQELPGPIDETQSFDGTGNNLDQPTLGAAGQSLARVAETAYEDGISAPAGAARPSPREISNTLSSAPESAIPSERGLSAFIYVWGQFLDHDIDLTEPAVDEEPFDIAVPTGDPDFDPSGTGQITIPFSRSAFDPATGTSSGNPRQQINRITAYIEGSQIYGSDEATASSLRSFERGRMLITEDGLLPLDAEGMVIAGDVRASENISLTALHVLFVREHNRLADNIAATNPNLTDEQIFQQARRIVIGELQAITYNEFLPALLGRGAMARYTGYDATVDPSIANEFSTAAYRFGHSTLNDDVEFFDNQGRAIRDEIALSDAFFNPSLLNETGIDSVLKYDASNRSQEIDLTIVDSLRNFLFGAPGSGGMDLAALNIQRGRDHGLADYNTTRVAYGLNAVTSFAEITSDAELQQKLKSLYGDVTDIDLWVGLLAEDHVSGASLGELAQTIIADQFERLRDGDRFYYENQFEGSARRTISQIRLADVIERNTTVEGLQENVFFMLAEVRGRVVTSAELTADAPQRGRRDALSAPGVAGVSVELLDNSGEVVDATVTDRRGNYRFRSFSETGDYQIRLTDSGATRDILITNGGTRLRGIDIELS